MSVPLTIEEVIKYTETNADWNFEDNRLKAEFTLEDFDTAMKVVVIVAEVAREMDHHPLWTNVYNQLSFSLCTHRAGDKVTELDLKLAERISAAVKEANRE